MPGSTSASWRPRHCAAGLPRLIFPAASLAQTICSSALKITAGSGDCISPVATGVSWVSGSGPYSGECRPGVRAEAAVRAGSGTASVAATSRASASAPGQADQVHAWCMNCSHPPTSAFITASGADPLTYRTGPVA